MSSPGPPEPLCPGDKREPKLAAMSENGRHDDAREAHEGALYEIKRVIIGQDAML